MKDKSKDVFDLLMNDHFVQWVQNPNEESMYYWQKWLENHPERNGDVAVARKILLSSKLKHSEKLPSESHDRILESIVEHSRASKHHVDIKSHHRSGIWKYAVAAAITILMIAAYVLENRPAEKPPVIASKPWLEKTTVMGQKMTTKLPDGSLVSLNSGTQFSFPESFDGDSRVVELIAGEAFFEIKKDPSKPFYVKINDDKVRVLGTSFNIRAYPDEPEIQVAVATGQVSYTIATGKKVILAPNQLATHTLNAGELETTEVDPKYSFAWKNKVLYFKGATLSEIIVQLERWYGFDFILQEGFSKKGTYSGEFDNQRLEEVLKGLSFIYEFGYKINLSKKEVILYDVKL